ncbi:HSP20 family molecular chaperone IbpA [Haloferula luteola]|uniref:HSP20 family molecular chaperone IbpA n=1 Tax=Haloferula luteola TaxID=595692 RepID=A0A840V3N7_9BACT|nr:Hsp20/alpha crystallin family protein [Haloferula luteola]MBB5352615.1 HSP20 family molecular chaperone IbpA [Haloferula luteola]
MILAPHLMNSRNWLQDFGQFVDQSIRHFEAPGQPFRLYEHDSGWTLEFDLPGVGKDAIHLEVRDRALLLQIDDQPSRSLPLGRSVDASAISAQMKDGVLQVRLPRAETSADTRRIEIL